MGLGKSWKNDWYILPFLFWFNRRVKQMNLRKREFGNELSGIEYKFIFEKENIGFVRFIDKENITFCLDPSPFLDTHKQEVYVLKNCSPPKNGALIEVRVSETDKKVIEVKNGYISYSIKYVHSWKRVDINNLSHRKVMHSDEFINFFSSPFSGEKEYLERLGQCLSLYAVSSPPISNHEKGGMNSAFLGKDRKWRAFKKVMNIIPSEFKQPTSKYFYRFLDKEEIINSSNSSEVSLAYHNPPSMPIQIPIVMEEIDSKPVSNYSENLKFEFPIAKAHILDSVLHEPEVPNSLERYITDCTYKLKDELMKCGSIPYTQHLGSAVPKLGISFARLDFKDKAIKDNITDGVNLWYDMFKAAKKISSMQLSPKELYKLTENARKLYITLNDVFGIDTKINRKDININMSEWDMEQALEELNLKGALYYPCHECYILLDYK